MLPTSGQRTLSTDNVIVPLAGHDKPRVVPTIVNMPGYTICPPARGQLHLQLDVKSGRGWLTIGAGASFPDGKR